MYGWRARLGVLVPSGNIVLEPEFNSVILEGVACYYHRFNFNSGGSDTDLMQKLEKAADYIADASELIVQVKPAVVAMTGTAVSFIGGYGYDQSLIKKMRERNGNLPTTTTSTSVIDALNCLGIKKVSMAMPYVEEVSRAAVKFVEESGLQVPKAKWLNKIGFDIPQIPKETIYQLAREVDDPECEAIFISCVSLHTFEIIEELERDLGKPVITSNQATIWNMLRLSGVKDKIKGYGQLLSDY
ncbi:Asp/Glu racemase [Chloroflexota bacterium]